MYRYQPLPPVAEFGRTPPYTRVLHLFPGQGEEPLHGRLEVVNIEAGVQYEALSYTWGTGDPSNYIWIGDEPLPIKPNLESALHRLRLGTQTRCLWIDALCIDQSSLQERSRQVQYMRLVYKHCVGAVVWLGPRTLGVDLAFDAAKRLVEAGRHIEEAQHRAGNSGNPSHEVSAITNQCMSSISSEAWEYLADLYKRDYFSRCWVLQEVAVAPRSLAMCDNLEIPFLDLISIVFLWQKLKGGFQARPLNVWLTVYATRNPRSNLRLTDVEGSFGPMLDLLENMRNFKATDSRDKIYSILGLCDEGLNPIIAKTHIGRSTDRILSPIFRAITGVQNRVNSISPQLEIGVDPALKPDYEKDIPTVYTDITRFFINKAPKLLHVLSYVQHRVDPSTSEFPSWVPRWFEESAFEVFRGGGFSAGICIPPASDLLNPRIGRAFTHPGQLSLDGFQVDIVQSVSDIIGFRDDPTEVTSAILRVWSQLFPFPIKPTPRHQYHTGETLDVAFCKAISIAPYGCYLGHSHLNMKAGLSPQLRNMSPVEAQKLTQRCIAGFLSRLSLSGDQTQSFQTELQSEEGMAAAYFRRAFTVFAGGRRVFVTRNGSIGMGPTIVRPGDEVVVLFRGPMPYVLRRRNDHHVLIGDCYIRDDNIMYGKVTKSVRHGKGGPPVQFYNIR